MELTKKNKECHNCGNNEFHIENVNQLLEINGKLFYIKEVPANICDRCGEKYFNPLTYDKIYEMIYNPNRNIIKVEADLLEFA